MEAARIGSAAFFAPPTDTSPDNDLPPLMIISSTDCFPFGLPLDSFVASF
jgi:hypothetical protein